MQIIITVLLHCCVSVVTGFKHPLYLSLILFLFFCWSESHNTIMENGMYQDALNVLQEEIRE